MTEKARPALPFLLGLFLFVVGISGIALIAFPDIVPFGVTLWEAAFFCAPGRSRSLVSEPIASSFPLYYGEIIFWPCAERIHPI